MQIEGIISGLREAAKKYEDEELRALVLDAEDALINVEAMLDDAYDAGKASESCPVEYILSLTFSKYMRVGEEWQTVEITQKFRYSDFDDVQNLIGYLTEGTDENIGFAIQKKEVK